jgi:hypothetical protein
MIARRLSALAIGGLCAGCALLLGYGEEVELAARGVESGAPAEASSEDAGADTSPEAAPDARPFCDSLSPKPTFCASFDRLPAETYIAEWGGTGPQENVRLDRDTSVFKSAPASLRVSLDRTMDAGVGGGVGVDFTAFQESPFTATIAFDVMVEEAAPQFARAVIANPLLVAGPAFPEYILQLICNPTTASSVSISLVEVKRNVPNEVHSTPLALVVKQWSHVELAIVIASLDGGTANTVRLTVDNGHFDAGLRTPIGVGVPATTLGIATVDTQAAAWVVRFDNATVDIH